MTTQTEQTEFFPRTTMEVLESLRAFHVSDVDKARTALDNLGDDEKVARRYEKAEERLAAARDLVRDIDRAIAELRTMEVAESFVQEVVDNFNSGAIGEEVAEIVNSGALDTDGMTVRASSGRVTPAVDPITGEVTPQISGVTCDNCVNDDCNLRQREGTRHTGCDGAGWSPSEPTDPITGEVVPAVVVALYPSDGDPHETQVGDRTRYGELVADYFTAAGLHDEHAEDWEVRALRELTQDGGGYRNLHDVITPEDYGQELLVVALEQGSVTGTPAEKVAT